MISVLIPTYNGEKKLLNLLEALANQTYNDFEIIIGVDGSTDSTIELIKQQKILNKDLIKIYYQENAGRSIIRNNIAKEAKGELLVFYDDDMIPEPNSIEKHFNFHKNNNKCILSGAQIDRYKEDKLDFLLYKEYLSRLWVNKYNNKLVKLEKDNLFLTAAHLSIQKSLFFLIEGFDEHLTDGEDWDLAVRAIEKGINIYFDATNIAYHTDSMNCKSYILRQRGYFFAQKRLNNTKKDLYKKYNKRSETPKLGFFRYTVYYILANKLNLNLIDKNIFVFLPKKFRFRYYDIVITGLSKIFYKRKI